MLKLSLFFIAAACDESLTRCLLSGILEPEPEWRNRQTRATQNRVGLTHVGSIPTSGIFREGFYRGATGWNLP